MKYECNVMMGQNKINTINVFFRIKKRKAAEL